MPFLPAYVPVTSPVPLRVCSFGKLQKNGNKEQKCTTKENTQQFGHSHAHFKVYLMLHISIFVRV